MYFDSKEFNPQAFGRYVDSLPNPIKTELRNSAAVTANAEARRMLSSQTGSVYGRIPFFGNISPDTSQNNNGSTDIRSSSTTTFSQGFVVASRMDGWTEKSFYSNITAGVKFMDNVGGKVNTYKSEVEQIILLKILAGIFSMSTSGSTAAAKGAKEFLAKHVYDISANTDDTGKVGETTLNDAITKASGDNKNLFSLVIMHSVIANRLENLNLLNYLKHTDANGIQRDLNIGTWNGRTVLVDDGMPTEEVAKTDSSAAYTKYSTYILGNNALNLDDIGDAVPYEMYRDPKTNGGQDTLYVRDRYICGAYGLSFENNSNITVSASNDDLANGLNWNIINDGKTYFPTKSIPLVKIVSRG